MSSPRRILVFGGVEALLARYLRGLLPTGLGPASTTAGLQAGRPAHSDRTWLLACARSAHRAADGTRFCRVLIHEPQVVAGLLKLDRGTPGVPLGALSLP